MMNSKVASEIRRFGPLIPAIWLVHVILGLTAALAGPALPFLRLNVGETFSVIGLVFSARSVGFMTASFVTGNVLRHLKEGWQKMAWIAGGVFTMAGSIFMMPLINNAFVLIATFVLFGLGCGTAETMNTALMVFLLGPRKARPMLQSLCFMVAVGAFFSPILARPFLLQMGTANISHNPCNFHDVNKSLDPRLVDEVREPLDFSTLLQSPMLVLFSISSGITAATALIFVILALRRPQLLHYATSKEEDSEMHNIENKEVTVVRRQTSGNGMKRLLVGLFVFFYILHAGTEQVFWTHTVTFGMCSALRLDAGKAALLGTCFFAGMLTGRALGVWISTLLHPLTIIIVELAGCILCTGVLAFWGESSAILVYITVVCYGLSISMVFAGGISWLAEQIDVTGAVSSSWYVGAMIGCIICPFLAGLLIDLPVGPPGVMYFVCGSSLATAVTFVALNFVAKCHRAPRGRNLT